MDDRIDSIIKWFIDRAYEVYSYILEDHLNIRSFNHNLNYYLSLSEMRIFMENFVDHWLDSDLTRIVQDNLTPEISSFFKDWGFSLYDHGGGFSIWKLGPIEAFLFEFIINHYESFLEGKEEKFYKSFKKRFTVKSVIIQHKIYMDSPLSVSLDIQVKNQNSNLSIELICFHPLKFFLSIEKKELMTVSFEQKGLNSLEDFSELPESPDVQSVFFLPPPYTKKVKYWEDIPVTFHPNTLLLINQPLMIHEFHKNCEKLHQKKRPNTYTIALDIGFVFVTLFNLLRLPSDVLEYRGRPIDIGDLEIPDETLLYPEKSTKRENPLIKEQTFLNIWGNRYYYIQINPSKVEFKKLNEFWTRFSNILLNRESFPHLDMACRRLYNSFKIPDPEDILLELIIGLEALFTLKGKSQETFYVSIGSLTPIQKRGETKAFAKSLYNIRSRIVHGEDFNKDLEYLFRKFGTLTDFSDLIFLTRGFLILGIIDYMTLWQKYQNKKMIVKYLAEQDAKELSEELRANYYWFYNYSKSVKII